jgi:hypothetical protein
MLKIKNKLCPFNKFSVFYNSYLKTFGSHLVYSTCPQCLVPESEEMGDLRCSVFRNSSECL